MPKNDENTQIADILQGAQPLDVSIAESLRGVDEQQSTLAQEALEASAARKEFNAAALMAFDRGTEIAQERSAILAKSASAQEDLLGQMQEHLTRLNEIGSTPFRAPFEPLIELFDPEDSRSGRVRSLARTQTQLDLVKARTGLEEARLRDKEAATLRDVRRAQLNYQNETSDVTAARQLLNDISASTDIRQSMTGQMLQTMDASELRTVEPIVGKEAVAAERARRESRTIVLQSQRRAAREATLTDTADDALQALVSKEPESPRGVAAAREIARRKDTALSRQVAQTEALKVHLGTLSASQLDRAAAEGKIPSQLISGEIDRRHNNDIAKQLNEAAVTTKNEELRKLAKKLTGEGMNLFDLEANIKAANENGGIYVAPNGLTFAVAELVEFKANHVQAQVLNFGMQTSTAGATQAIDAAMSSLQRMAGLGGTQVSEDGTAPSLVEQARVMAQSPHLAGDVRAAAARTASALEAVKDLPDTAQALAVQQAASSFLEAEAAQLKRRMATVPNDERLGYQEYFDTGIIRSQQNAYKMAVSPVLNGDTRTESVVHNTALQAIGAIYAEQGRAKALLVGDQDIALRNLLTDPNNRKEVLVATQNTALALTYETAARTIDDPQLQQLLQDRNSILYPDGKFSEIKLMQVLADPSREGMSMADFQTHLVKASQEVVSREMEPRGEEAPVQAALNNILFGNKQQQLFPGFVMNHLVAIRAAAVRATQAEQRSGGLLNFAGGS